MVDKKKLFIQFEYNAKKAIEKSYKNENGSLEKIEKSIIKIFSELTKKNYNVNTFKKEILKKKIPSTSRSKKILKLMYKLIFLPESDIEKANKNYNLLIKIITKLNEKSCLYEFKADLKKVSKTLFTYKKSKISKLSNKNPDLENKEKTQKTNYKEEEKLDPLENKEKIKNRKRSNALESRQKFKEIEQQRKSNSFSVESFSAFLNIHENIINNANKILESNGFEKIPLSILSPYKEIVSKNDQKITIESYHNEKVSDMISTVKKEINEARSKSIFENSPLNSNKILEKITKVYKSKSTKDKIKNEFKNSKINLLDSSEKEILGTIQNALENEEFESSKEKIVNILKSRNVSRDLTYKNCQIKALNYDSNSWKKIEKSIKIKGKNGQNINATISSTPASELGIYTNLKKGQGISSNNRNTDHAMNLWKTEVKTDNGETLFKGLRHGNTRGKESATKEIILAAALDQYGLEKLQNSSEKDVFEVKMGNVQLITDSIIGDGNLGELQKDSFNNLAGKIFEIEIKDKDNSHKKIRLKLKQPILVNFGMNAQYYALDGSLTRSSKGMNSEAFNKLFGENIMKKLKEKFSKKKEIEKIQKFDFKESEFGGEVGNFLKDTSEKNSLNKKKVVNLSNQILYIWVSTNGRGNKENPSAMQTRLAALIFLIGYSISFNCKSGKDRTGALSAEINDLILTMEANDGEPPKPYGKLSDEEKLQLREVFEATDSETIAQINTGYRGLKVDYRKSTDRLGKMSGNTRKTFSF